MANAKEDEKKAPSAPRKRGRPPKRPADAKNKEGTVPTEEAPIIMEQQRKNELPLDQRTFDEEPYVPRSLPHNAIAQPPLMNQQRDSRRSYTITLRAPLQLVDDVDYWVNNRSYKSRSEFILASIRYYLDYLEYRESFNVRTFQRGQTGDVPSERFDRLRYLRGNP